LRPNEFSTDAPGRLLRDPKRYWTYEPDALPPKLSFDAGLVKKLSEADRALGELAGVGSMLPNPHLLIGPFLRREAVLQRNRVYIAQGIMNLLDEQDAKPATSPDA
jgi:hypothetical protein